MASDVKRWPVSSTLTPTDPTPTEGRVRRHRRRLDAIHRSDVEMREAGDLETLVDNIFDFVEMPRRESYPRYALLGVVLAIVGGFVVAFGGGSVGVAMIGLVGLVALVWIHPPIAGYIMIGTAPLIVGFGRDQVLPRLRPNEALLAVLLVVLVARWMIVSREIKLRLHRIDFVMLAVVSTGFFLPLITQVARLKPLSVDDILYALVFVKLGLLYCLVRSTIKTPAQVRVALGISLLFASGLGIMGLMDSLNIAATADRLHRFFPNDGFIVDDGRGAASIGNPIGFGVYQAINAMIALAMLLGNERPRWLVGAAAVCTSLGVIGSGQIGPTLSFMVGIAAIAIVTRSVGRLFRLSLPFLVLALIITAPLIQRRVAGFDGPGIPSATRTAIQNQPTNTQGESLYEANPGSSWDVRLYNLEMFFLPSFRDTSNVVWGVTPQARVASPREGEEFIWIESGHLWLIWSGGIPLFITWFVFIGVGMHTARRILRSRAGPVGIAAAATFGALAVVNIAQTFDPHMTLRGTADILYPLLALMMVGYVDHQQAWSGSRLGQSSKNTLEVGALSETDRVVDVVPGDEMLNDASA